jgi:hypothetical protein
VDNYPDIKIFNLSLNAKNNSNIHEWKKWTLTRIIDKISYKYKVIIIISSWNHNTFRSKSYLNCLLDNDSVITSPADTVNWLSVWSLARLASTNAIAKEIEVSPFSRCWLDNELKKPDLVHFWWNIDIYESMDGIWENWLSNNNDNVISENVWTSFSAPLVSWIAGRIMAYLEKTWMVTNTFDMTKALLLHSARYSFPEWTDIDETHKNKLVWFWIPDFNLAFDNTPNSAMFLYNWTLENFEDQWIENKNKNKIKFTIPKELKEVWKKLRIKWTLVYTTPVERSGDLNYTLSDIQLNLYNLNSNGTLTVWDLPNAKENYRIKWNPIKYFEKEIKSSSYSSWEWEILLQLNLRWELDMSNYKQDYALVISIEDITPDESKRVEIWNIIKNQYKQYNMLEIKTKIKV